MAICRCAYFNGLQYSKTEFRSESSLAVTSLIARDRDGGEISEPDDGESGSHSLPIFCSDIFLRQPTVKGDPTTNYILLDGLPEERTRESQADRHDHKRVSSAWSDDCWCLVCLCIEACMSLSLEGRHASSVSSLHAWGSHEIKSSPF